MKRCLDAQGRTWVNWSPEIVNYTSTTTGCHHHPNYHANGQGIYDTCRIWYYTKVAWFLWESRVSCHVRNLPHPPPPQKRFTKPDQSYLILHTQWQREGVGTKTISFSKGALDEIFPTLRCPFRLAPTYPSVTLEMPPQSMGSVPRVVFCSTFYQASPLDSRIQLL